MPKIAKWIGDSIETVFSSLIYPARVTQVEYLSDRLKRVRFEGSLGKKGFTPGNVVEFRVTDTDYRHYTPSIYDQTNGICEILFYLHDKGVGSQWAGKLKVGDEMKLMGPGGRIKYDKKNKYHFFFGDETSIGLYLCLKHAAHQNNHEYLCILELDEAHKPWPELLGLSAEVVEKSSANPGQNAAALLEEMQGNCWTVWQHATFYLTGNARSIQAFRKELIVRGVKSKQIQTEPYWVEGKRGL